MATFSGYNTAHSYNVPLTISQTVVMSPSTFMGGTWLVYGPLTANAPGVVGPIETGIANRLVGSCFSDQNGTLTIYQSFEDPSANHWDVVSGLTDGSAGNVAITGGTPVYFDLTSVAPFAKAVFTNGATPQTVFRMYMRAFHVDRG